MFSKNFFEEICFSLLTSGGHEDWRKKWSPLVRKYWKLSERLAVKYAAISV
ncbi:MAG: DUF1972 domain-containing protein [Oribacterium sp.]|nr:DUF1972 domain-containing protein [Butyrivibrio sp.]MBP3806462.1 DUF1972 domain-containing protein [Oribacterium sp.]